MSLDQTLYRVSKVTRLDLKNWKTLSLLSDEEVADCCYRNIVIEEEFVKAPLSLHVFTADLVDGQCKELFCGLRPYFTAVDLCDYGGSEHLPVYVVNMEEIACWRQDYELQDIMHTACTQNIKNTGYYLCDEDMLVAVKDHLEAEGEEPDFDPENGEEENLIYWEWY